MIYPTYPRIIPDRDEVNDWYLDEDCIINLSGGHTLFLEKGFRFDSHSVPWYFQWLFPKYVKTPPGKPNDIYAAVVHDALIALDHWHRFNRKYEDNEYKRFMNMPEYKINNFRSTYMPKGVRLYGWAKFDLWGDYRGEPKKNTYISVKVHSGDIL